MTGISSASASSIAQNFNGEIKDRFLNSATISFLLVYMTAQSVQAKQNIIDADGGRPKCISPWNQSGMMLEQGFDPAAVDGDAGAVDGAGALGGEERDERGKFVGTGEAA